MTLREWLKEHWYYRELFFFMVWRDVKIRYKQTVLGAVWAIIQPFITMIVFTLIFGKLAGMASDDMDYPVFYYCGMLPWTYFAGALRYSSESLVMNAQLVQKVYFPRAILPASPALAGLLDLSISSLILVPLLIKYDVHPTWELLVCPLLVIPLVFLALGAGMFLSALNVKYRDVKHAVPFLIQLWFFGSAIIYPMSSIKERFGEKVYVFLLANPVTGIIEAFRQAVSPARSVDWGQLGISFSVVLAVLLIGAAYFRKTEREFADTI